MTNSDTTERVSLPVVRERGAAAGEASLVAALRDALRGDVRFGEHDRMLYATDASIYQVPPIGVVIPADVDDAIAAARICAEHGAAILPRGGGTSLAGQCVNHAVVLDYSVHCRTIGEIDGESLRVDVEPGVALDELNDELVRRGRRLFFAPDVATSKHATIGGMIGNNSAGARSVVYGHTCDHVEAIDGVTIAADGGVERLRFTTMRDMRDGRARELATGVIDIVRKNERLIRERFPGTPRKVSGYSLDRMLEQLDAGGEDALNLATLLCGSEGTLAMTTSATLRLTPLPVARRLSWIAFTSLDAALAAAPLALATKPSAVELLDDTALGLAKQSRSHRANLAALPALPEGAQTPAVLLVEHSALRDIEELDTSTDSLRDVLAPARVEPLTDAQAQQAWALRKAVEPLLHAIPGARKPVTFVEDAAAPPERLQEFVQRFRQIVESRGLRAAFFAHASVGVLHIRPMLDLHDADDRQMMRDIAVDVADLAREMGGALSGEHGDGRVRGPLLERYFGPELMSVFTQIKQLFDPRNLLNPGNIAAPGALQTITENLRVAPANSPGLAPTINTYFDYHEQGGLASALEACNGSGVCRKKTGGVMCPSFMATLDERHSTRGRANALRLAFTGQRGKSRESAPILADVQTLQTLDLCLSCKACKSECPSDVDVARLKSEYLAQSRRAGMRTTARDRLLANLRLVQRVGALAPGVATAIARSALARRIAVRALGLAPDRALPRFGGRIAQGLHAANHKGARNNISDNDSDKRRRVALFVDCFTGFGESAIARDAIALLTTWGVDVVVRDVGCCQRPALSLGMLEHAKKRTPQFLRQLAALSADVDAALFLEPSCLSAVVDDLQALRSGASVADRSAVASNAMLFESYCVSEALPMNPSHNLQEILLHAHCHQKALAVEASSAAFLDMVAGDGSVRTLDATCCGMAGAFGMLKEHQELSRRIAELSLAPAVRSAPDGALVAATGASCRQQIRDMTGREALHPAQIAAKMLASGASQGA